MRSIGPTPSHLGSRRAVRIIWYLGAGDDMTYMLCRVNTTFGREILWYYLKSHRYFINKYSYLMKQSVKYPTFVCTRVGSPQIYVHYLAQICVMMQPTHVELAKKRIDTLCMHATVSISFSSERVHAPHVHNALKYITTLIVGTSWKARTCQCLQLLLSLQSESNDINILQCGKYCYGK